MLRAAFVLALAGTVAEAQEPPREALLSAEYAEPVARYGHNVLGDTPEWGALRLVTRDCLDCTAMEATIRLPPVSIFEDIAPRPVDLDGDGLDDAALVVESALGQGARVALYDARGQVASTPYIGQQNRWFAPVGAADLDGDGRVEIAAIDRPHLAKTLRVWRYENGQLTEIVAATGLTNHRIGEAFISGGLRDCDGRIEMILVNSDWSRVMAVRLDGGALRASDLGPYRARESFAAALACR